MMWSILSFGFFKQSIEQPYSFHILAVVLKHFHKSDLALKCVDMIHNAQLLNIFQIRQCFSKLLFGHGNVANQEGSFSPSRHGVGQAHLTARIGNVLFNTGLVHFNSSFVITELPHSIS